MSSSRTANGERRPRLRTRTRASAQESPRLHHRDLSAPAVHTHGTAGEDSSDMSPPVNGHIIAPAPAIRDQSKSRHLKQKYRLDDLDVKNTLGTGTFGRVVLVKHRPTKDYFALKILPIVEVIRLKQVEHVKNEKAILLMVKHPFIVNLLWADHNDRFLYMLLEYVCGGELFTYLRNAGRFGCSAALFYSSEIVLALEYLHSLSFVYRDLKPENLLLDRQGHLKITDFGFAKKLEDRTWTLCGTPEYLAPEIIQSKGHNKAVDWWALGILVYEMLVGYPPFFDDQPFGIYEKILAGKIDWPKHLDPIVRDLIKKLLVQDRTKRLGNMKNGAQDVKNHRWFRNVSWDDVVLKRIEPPIVPRIRHTGDTRNFFEYPEQELRDWFQAPLPDSPLKVEPPIIPHVEFDGDSRNFDVYPETKLNGFSVDSAFSRPSRDAMTLFEDF